MSEMTIIIILAVIGVIVWLINNYVQMPDTAKTIFNIIAGILTVAWMLYLLRVAFGAA